MYNGADSLNRASYVYNVVINRACRMYLYVLVMFLLTPIGCEVRRFQCLILPEIDTYNNSYHPLDSNA